MLSESLRTLLFQLCADRDDLSEDVRFSLVSIAAALRTKSSEEDDKTIKSYMSLLRQVLDQTKENVFIVIDGLDELSKRPRQLLLRFLARLLRSEKPAVLRVLISSRQEGEVFEFGYPSATIKVDRNPDIELIVDSRLGSEYSSRMLQYGQQSAFSERRRPPPTDRG